MSVPPCTRNKPDGTVCNSPASRGKPLCYFHPDRDARCQSRKSTHAAR